MQCGVHPLMTHIKYLYVLQKSQRVDYRFFCLWRMNTITPIITSTAITAKDTVGTATAAATVDTDDGYLSTPTWYVRFCPIMTCKFCDVDSRLPQEWKSSFTYQHWCFKNAIWSFLRRQAKQLQDCRKIKYYNSSILLEFRNFALYLLRTWLCFNIAWLSPNKHTDFTALY